MKHATLTVALLAAVLLCACSKKEDIGPAQKAGKAVDDAGAKIASDLHEKIDKAKAVGDTLEKSAQDTAAKIDEATADASKGLNKATEELGKKVERAGEKIQEAAKK